MEVKHSLTLAELKRDYAIKLEDGMIIINQETSFENEVNIENLIKKYDYCYSQNEKYVCFIDEKEVFITFKNQYVIDFLEDHKFKAENFIMPLSEDNVLKYQKVRMNKVKERLNDVLEQQFSNYCIKYCEENGIFSLAKEQIENCFEIPEKGITVKRKMGIIQYMPFLQPKNFDKKQFEMLGKYNAHNGRVSFVYRDGKTYIAKGYAIIYELEKAGYQRANMLVPISNGEEIINPELRALWEKIVRKS